MIAVAHRCQSCAAPLRTSKRELHRCRDCGGEFCGQHIYIWVDGANEAITRNGPNLCEACYIKRHGDDR